MAYYMLVKAARGAVYYIFITDGAMNLGARDENKNPYSSDIRPVDFIRLYFFRLTP